MDQEARTQEEKHVKHALKRCQNLLWAIVKGAAQETVIGQTRAINEKVQLEQHKSTNANYCKIENHVVDFQEASVICTEVNKYQHWITETIEIRQLVLWTINRDEGAFMLSPTWSGTSHTNTISRDSDVGDKISLRYQN